MLTEHSNERPKFCYTFKKSISCLVFGCEASLSKILPSLQFTHINTCQTGDPALTAIKRSQDHKITENTLIYWAVMGPGWRSG
jgi:hypothetical protein